MCHNFLFTLILPVNAIIENCFVHVLLKYLTCLELLQGFIPSLSGRHLIEVFKHCSYIMCDMYVQRSSYIPPTEFFLPDLPAILCLLTHWNMCFVHILFVHSLFVHTLTNQYFKWPIKFHIGWPLCPNNIKQLYCALPLSISESHIVTPLL